jgi:hypothetical protein
MPSPGPSMSQSCYIADQGACAIVTAAALQSQGALDSKAASARAQCEMDAIVARVQGNRSSEAIIDWSAIRLIYIGALRKALEILESSA